MERDIERELDRSISDLRSDNSIIKNEIEHLNKLHDKIDVSIIRLDATSNRLDNMLSLQERSIETLKDLISTYQNMNISRFDALEDINKEKENQIERKIDSIRLNNSEQMTDIISRLTAIEKWRWTIMGGMIVIAGILTFFGVHIFDLRI